MESVGELVMGALSTGGVVVARAEIARLVQGAVRRLSRRGRVCQELAVVADALARSDGDLAAEMEHLGSEPARQLDEALVYDGPDEAERRATGELRVEAERVRGLLTQVQSVGENRGQVVQASGNSTVHMPFSVGRDYIAGQRPGWGSER